MSYNINLGSWKSIFAVPSAVVDQHLRLASEAQIKVLLYLLRHAGEALTEEDLASALRISPEEVKNSLTFWIERELLKESDSSLIPADQNAVSEPIKPEAAQPAPKAHPTVPSRAQRPDHAFAAKLISEDACLKGMLDEISASLSKPLSPGDIDTLVMLYTTFDLPCEVIAMMVAHLADIGSANMRAIEKAGISWSDKGIRTVADAEKEIDRYNASHEAWGRVSSLLGIKNVGRPTASQMDHADRWLNIWCFSDEMILEAYERCVNTKGEYSIRYVNAILQKWYEKGIKSLDALKAHEANQISKKSKRSTDKKGSMFSLEGASFDISRYENDTLFDD